MDYDLDGRADIFMMDGGCAGQIFTNSSAPFASTRGNPEFLVSQGDGTAIQAVPYVGAPVGLAGGFVPNSACPDYVTSRVMDVNGDGLPDFVQMEGDPANPSGIHLIIHLRQRDPAGKPDLLKTITDGSGYRVDVQYAPITDASVHTPVTCSYPQSCNPRGMWIVASHQLDVGGKPRSYTHKYQGARTDLQGLGWLGMDQHTETDQTDASAQPQRLSTEHLYDHVNKFGTPFYPLAGKPYRQQVDATIPGPSAGQQTIISRSWQTNYPVVTLNGAKRAVVLPDTTDFSEIETVKAGTSLVLLTANKTSHLATNYNTAYGYLISKTLTVGADGSESGKD